jgi:hypothetical protein
MRIKILRSESVIGIKFEKRKLSTNNDPAFIASNVEKL